MKSIDGILPRPKTKRRKHVPFYPVRYVGPIAIAPHPESCLHKQCPGCINGTCSGVHMLSCPCRSCSPTMNSQPYDPKTYSLLSSKDIILYNPNVISIRRKIISA